MSVGLSLSLYPAENLNSLSENRSWQQLTATDSNGPLSLQNCPVVICRPPISDSSGSLIEFHPQETEIIMKRGTSNTGHANAGTPI